MPHRVLLVEDNAVIRATLIPAIEELADANVVAFAENFSGAMKAIGEVAWDILVLDMFLGDGTGLDVLRNMTSGERSGKKVLVLTNYVTADIRRQCMLLGAAAVFDKSTEFDGFLEACA